MAIEMEVSYHKTHGLPGHSYSLTLRIDAVDPSQVQAESSRLHALLQTCVETESQKKALLSRNNGNGHAHPGNGQGEAWVCRRNQRKLILRIIAEQKLEGKAVDQLTQEKFGKAVRELSPLEASALIEELRERHPNGRQSSDLQFPLTTALAQ